MTKSELETFLTIEQPDNIYRKLYVYPNKSIVDLYFNDKVNDMENEIPYKVNFVTKTISWANNELIFTSTNNVKDIVHLKFNDVFIHPTIAEIIV